MNFISELGTPLGQNVQHLDLSQGRMQSPMIPDILTPGSMRSRKYRSPIARGGSLDQGQSSTGVNSDPVRQLIKKLRTEKRDR